MQVSPGDSTDSRTLTTYGPYALPGEFKDLRLTIKTDIGVLAPEFQGYSRDDPQLFAALGIQSGAREVLEHSGWGTIVPYAYAATYHFLGRLFYGLSTSGPLLPKSRKMNVSFTLVLVSDTQVFHRRAAASLHGAGVGYWNAGQSEAGILINKGLFRWAGYQSGWKGRSAAEEVQSFGRYITRLTIREIGHEMFHAVQSFTDSRFYHFPLLAEGTALLAQYNVFDREEMVVLIGRQRQANASRVGDSCLTAMTFSKQWPGDFFSMLRIRRAYDAVMHRKAFSLSEVLLLDDTEFYGASGTELEDRYAIALSVLYFLRNAGPQTRRDWEAVLQEAYETDDIRSNRKAASRIDAAYLTWMKQLAAQWWKSRTAPEKYKSALEHQTRCLGEDVYLLARLWAIDAGAYVPESPTPALYMGDVFFRVDEPFAALDYYKLAESRGHPERFDEYPSRIRSRVGDALEQLGDIEDALRQYEALLSRPPESPWLMTMFARTRLKLEYYRLTEASGAWRSEENRNRLNRYVSSLQTGDAAKVAQEKGMRGDAQGFAAAVDAQYRLVRAQMRRDLAGN